MTSPNGYDYQGDFRYRLSHRRGVWRGNGDECQGQFQYCQFHGIGSYTTFHGSICEGISKSSELTGRG
jgi:hypothetical protein